MRANVAAGSILVGKPWWRACRAGAMIAFTAVAFLAQSVDAAVANKGVAPDGAHKMVKQILLKISASRKSIDDAVIRNDFTQAIKIHAHIQEKLREVRGQMDYAFLRGAWSQANAKKSGADLAGQLESVRLLNFIVLAMLTGYEYPAKKIPDSVIDANERMFSQLDITIAKADGISAMLHTDTDPPP